MPRVPSLVVKHVRISFVSLYYHFLGLHKNGTGQKSGRLGKFLLHARIIDLLGFTAFTLVVFGASPRSLTGDGLRCIG